MTAPESGINMRGAVDLSALANPPAAQEPVGGDFVIEATAATFTAIVDQSQTVPVIVELYSGRSQASVQLTNTLQALVKEYAGKFLLARVNADTEADIVAAFGVQAVPTTVAIVKTQPIPLFQGVHDAAQIKQVLDDVLRVAAENGVTGTLEGSGEPAPEPQEEPLPPNIQAAYDAIERQDYTAAIDAFKAELASNPADAEAKAGMVQAELFQRLEGHDPAQVLAEAQEASPSDVGGQLLAADVEMSRGELAAAFARVLGVVKATAGAERDLARERLVELFLLAPAGSPEVAQARKDLALALF